MTVFARSTDLPPAIDRLERLLLWCALLLETMYRGQSYKEATGSAIDSGLAPLIDISIVSAADGSKRAIIRAAVELNPAYTNDKSQKLWMFGQAMGNAVIPAAFKAD